MKACIKEQLESLTESDWQPLRDKKGYRVEVKETYHTSSCIGDYKKPFTLVIQRKRIKGQVELDLEADDTGEEISSQSYIYRAIATNQDGWDTLDSCA